MATHDTITLSGRVTNASDLSQAMAVARAYAPEGRVENLVQVGGVHQVMLEVRVAEMQKSLLRRLGVNFNYTTTSGKFGVSTLGGLTQVVNPDDATLFTPGPFGIVQSAVVNAMLRFTSSGATWTGFIDALKEEGLLKILAEPNLIALSGQQAYFLAGGEFPVPIPQGLGTVGIEYKPFGVGLSFTPTVLNEDKISINVAPEVSELDFSTAVRIEGYVVPGLSTRKASTVVELADGQSFAIAGLLRDTVRDTVSKYPLLGDIPILGTLFRSRDFQRNETELVIIVTPHLVKPLNEMEVALPTDYYRVPTDAELYVENLMVGRPKGPQGKMEGEFGHVVPKPTD
jgi:pilus assembly protein CpaC